MDHVKGAKAVAVGPHGLQLWDGIQVHRSRANSYLGHYLKHGGEYSCNYSLGNSRMHAPYLPWQRGGKYAA